jgi:hypothetical protein
MRTLVCGASLLLHEKQTIDPEEYVSATFLPFLRALWKNKRHGYSVQDGAIPHTANCYFNVLKEVLH